AQEYFEKLEQLSNQLQHQKYYETAIFMNGFCAFKTENYEEALNQFIKLESEEIQFINKFQFYFLYGRVLRLSGLNKKAIEMFLRAREVSNEIEESDIVKEKRAKLFLEVGHTHYNMAIETVKNGEADQTTVKSYLQKTINYYEDCAKIWEGLNNYNGLISINQLIGNVHEVLNQLNQSIGYYRKALKYAELINDILSRLHIFNLIIQVLERLELHDIIVKEIDEMLSKIKTYAFIDLFTISRFHRQLGMSLFKLGRKKEALSELLISMNIYNNFEEPIIDSLDTLQNIIEIYKNYEEDKYIQYYQDQYNQLQEKIQAAEIKGKKDFGVLGELKELWVLYEDGTTLFSYAPETKFDPNLFGGFLTALQSFSLELTSEYMDSMTMGLDQYTFYREENCNIFIMGRSSVKTSMNLVTKSLKTIYKNFWNQYEKFLEKFDGFVGRFSNFINWIENS
ncbi:MAG: tetratricopeptide repeat protein, partial [Promethearchaeota archaeon]